MGNAQPRKIDPIGEIPPMYVRPAPSNHLLEETSKPSGVGVIAVVTGVCAFVAGASFTMIVDVLQRMCGQ